MLSKTDITGGRTSGKLSDGQNKTTTNQFINQLGGIFINTTLKNWVTLPWALWVAMQTQKVKR
ncbi:hypothetical protein [Escherichia coli]|uniref:hypothetical protein n=1 Tax=Escherichia coli TaxID=562 RepID=UPI0038B06A61